MTTTSSEEERCRRLRRADACAAFACFGDEVVDGLVQLAHRPPDLCRPEAAPPEPATEDAGLLVEGVEFDAYVLDAHCVQGLMGQAEHSPEALFGGAAVALHVPLGVAVLVG